MTAPAVSGASLSCPSTRSDPYELFSADVNSCLTEFFAVNNSVGSFVDIGSSSVCHDHRQDSRSRQLRPLPDLEALSISCGVAKTVRAEIDGAAPIATIL